jgi:hypothetical protein
MGGAEPLGKEAIKLYDCLFTLQGEAKPGRCDHPMPGHRINSRPIRYSARQDIESGRALICSNNAFGGCQFQILHSIAYPMLVTDKAFIKFFFSNLIIKPDDRCATNANGTGCWSLIARCMGL